jgi:PAS domain S-box-containing protein
MKVEPDHLEPSGQTLRESEQMLRSLFEFAPDAIAVLDRTGRIMGVNAQAERMFGYPREELVGQPVEMLMPERYRDRHTKHRAGYMAEPRTRPMGVGLELYGRRNDGTEFALDIMSKNLSNERLF